MVRYFVSLGVVGDADFGDEDLPTVAGLLKLFLVCPSSKVYLLRTYVMRGTMHNNIIWTVVMYGQQMHLYFRSGTELFVGSVRGGGGGGGGGELWKFHTCSLLAQCA